MMRDELSSIATDVNTFGLCPPLFHPSSFALHKPVTIKHMMLGGCASLPPAYCAINILKDCRRAKRSSFCQLFNLLLWTQEKLFLGISPRSVSGRNISKPNRTKIMPQTLQLPQLNPSCSSKTQDRYLSRMM